LRYIISLIHNSYNLPINMCNFQHEPKIVCIYWKLWSSTCLNVFSYDINVKISCNQRFYVEDVNHEIYQNVNNTSFTYPLKNGDKIFVAKFISASNYFLTVE